jgi:predicted FMN-binding regulatory protein PaiB
MEIPAKSAGSLDPIISEIQIEVFRQRMRYKNSDNKNSDEQCKVNKQITKNSQLVTSERGGGSLKPLRGGGRQIVTSKRR